MITLQIISGLKFQNHYQLYALARLMRLFFSFSLVNTAINFDPYVHHMKQATRIW